MKDLNIAQYPPNICGEVLNLKSSRKQNTNARTHGGLQQEHWAHHEHFENALAPSVIMVSGRIFTMIYAKMLHPGQGSREFTAHDFAEPRCGSSSSTARDAALLIVHTINSSFQGRGKQLCLDNQFYAARSGILRLDGRKRAFGNPIDDYSLLLKLILHAHCHPDQTAEPFQVPNEISTPSEG
ncbi:MAG: hypothetical protein CJBNEKGG_03369 [Prosthecobacter sp.]|nr:hypothetical protein [Prosthecobacter sp.]